MKKNLPRTQNTPCVSTEVNGTKRGANHPNTPSVSSWVRGLLPVSFVFLLAMPASTNYKLKDYGFGSGGTGNSSSGNYSMEAITGEVSEDQSSSASYKIGPGLIFLGQANVPIAPTFTNPGDYYNKLLLVINVSGNPSDTLFAIAISTDINFATTNYVQMDNTVGATLELADYRTYTGWGETGGVDVIGLSPGIPYYVKAKAMQGNFSETGYGPVASVATVNPTLTFDIDVSASDEETNPPFAIALPDLTATSVISSTEKIWVDFATNSASGGNIYVSGQNGGLSSMATAYTIASDSVNLDSPAEGFGAQGSTATGGIAIVAPYNQTGNNIVGIVNQTIRNIFIASAPVAAGRGSFLLKAKSSAITPAAADYTETLTVIASGNF